MTHYQKGKNLNFMKGYVTLRKITRETYDRSGFVCIMYRHVMCSHAFRLSRWTAGPVTRPTSISELAYSTSIQKRQLPRNKCTSKRKWCSRSPELA